LAKVRKRVHKTIKKGVKKAKTSTSKLVARRNKLQKEIKQHLERVHKRGRDYIFHTMHAATTHPRGFGAAKDLHKHAMKVAGHLDAIDKIKRRL